MNKGNSKLLTIAIPTYNRAQYLDQCLSQICKQVRKYNEYIELIVSDNCSSDDTYEVVKKYVDDVNDIIYLRNEENIGADNNFIQCFKQASGKYVWIFGDDDVLLDGALDKIMNIIQQGNYGVIYVNSYGFKNNWRLERPNNYYGKNTVVYETQKAFLHRVSYFLTFVTGSICNKSLAVEIMDLSLLRGTNLPQLGWSFAALLRAECNVVINEFLIAATVDNSGGYDLCKVFGENFNKIMKSFIPKGLSISCIDMINKELNLSFFPYFIVKQRQGNSKFDHNDLFKMLYPLFNRYLMFWICVVPLIYLPVKCMALWLVFVRVLNRVVKIGNKILDVRLKR